MNIYREDVLIQQILNAKQLGIKTWVSFEPVLNDIRVANFIIRYAKSFDKVKIGKLNYCHSDIDWGHFGRYVQGLCEEFGVNYYIKDSLRAEMEKR